MNGLIGGRILVAGAGVSGAGAARMLTDLHADVTVADDNEIARQKVHEATGAPDISCAQAENRIGTFDLVVTSPGWRPDTPLLKAAKKADVPVLGDVELAWRLDQEEVFGPARDWIVITGTNGKTTTTAMCAAMFAGGPRRAAAVGNIGVPVESALTAEPRIEVLVAELSSFQLHWSSQFTPTAGALLNLADDHIDWHGSFQAYAETKAKALYGDVAVVGVDDPHVREQVNRLRAEGMLKHTVVVGFTLKNPDQSQVGLRDGWIVDRAFADGADGCGEKIAPAMGISPAGVAGQLDALAATALARSQGISPEDISQALTTFQVAAHRGQVVAEKNGVIWIDNSKATNPHAADAAMAGHESIVWIAGGQLKGARVDELVTTYAGKLKAVLVLGTDRKILADKVTELAPGVPVITTDSPDPKEAMQILCRKAHALSDPGDVVLLAPAAASLDMYTGMGQRGDFFAAEARALTGSPQENV